MGILTSQGEHVKSDFPKSYVIQGATKVGRIYLVEGGMSSLHNELYFHIQFFSDEAMTQEVKPTVGDVDIQTSPDNSNFYNLDVGGQIDLSKMYLPTFTQTSAAGPIRGLRIQFLNLDVSAAPFFKATIDRY